MTRRRWRKRAAERQCYDCGRRVAVDKGAWVIRGGHERLVHAGKCPVPPLRAGGTMPGGKRKETMLSVCIRVALAVLAGAVIGALLGCSAESRYTQVRTYTVIVNDGALQLTTTYAEEHTEEPEGWGNDEVLVPAPSAPRPGLHINPMGE